MMKNITDIKERYLSFKENEIKTWCYRFVWRGIYGDTASYSTSIFKFFSQNKDLLITLKNTNSIDKLFKTTQKLANEYIKWVKKTNDIYKKIEYDDMRNFFIGAIGEFFFTYLLDDVKCLLSENKKQNGTFIRNDFNYVAPRLFGENDFGVDLTCIANDKPTVVQVKFWNPYSPQLLTNEIAQSCFADGVCNNFIKSDDMDNVVICWLGDTDKKVSVHLKNNTLLYQHIIFIDKKSLKESIENKNYVFWENIYEKLVNFVENFQ